MSKAKCERHENTLQHSPWVKGSIFTFTIVILCSKTEKHCRWSKIARQLPGRTDNEIKNYWRTRIQKRIKQQGDAERVHEQMMSIGSCSETNDDHAISPCSQVSSFNNVVEPMEISHDYFPPYEGDTEAMAFQQTTWPRGDGANDDYWSMEDLWSMQLLDWNACREEQQVLGLNYV